MPLELGKGALETVENGQVVITVGDRSYCVKAIVIDVKNGGVAIEYEECIKDGDVMINKLQPKIIKYGDDYESVATANPITYKALKEVAYQIISDETGEAGEIT